MKADRTEAAILANGDFPTHPVPLSLLRTARRILCCDGAADRLAGHGLEPYRVIGDLDSLSPEGRERFAGKLVREEEQATNDLAKAFRFACARGWRRLCILGATGGREDHTLANLGLLADFAESAEVRLYTDTGLFTPCLRSTVFASYPGQQVSIFSFAPGIRLYGEGLVYPLDRVPFTRWWQAALNEASGREFKLTFVGGPLLVYQAYSLEEEGCDGREVVARVQLRAGAGIGDRAVVQDGRSG